MKYITIKNPLEISDDQREKNYKLTFVNISNGNLTINKISFKQTMNLKIIDIGRNYLDKFSFKIFGNSSNIHYLNLNGNLIERIDKWMFDKLENLYFLKLSNNQLKIIEKNSFNHMKHLHYVELFNNQLEFISKNLFSEAKNIQYLMIFFKKSKLYIFDKEIFKNFKNLRELKTSHKLFCDYGKQILNLKKCEWKYSIKEYPHQQKFLSIIKLLLLLICLCMLIILLLEIYIFKKVYSNIGIFIKFLTIFNDVCALLHLFIISFLMDMENGNLYLYFQYWIKNINFCLISHIFINYSIFSNYLIQLYLNIYQFFHKNGKFFQTHIQLFNKFIFFLLIIILPIMMFYKVKNTFFKSFINKSFPQTFIGVN